MISPDEIKRQALKWWKPFLQSYIGGEAFFPRTIERIGKVQPGEVTGRFDTLQKEIEQLYRHSKNHKGSGYLVETSVFSFRRTGSHELPDRIVFETVDDYLAVTGKKREWAVFLSNYDLITSTIAELKLWSAENCLWLTEQSIQWHDVLKVCRYFISTPRPDLYLRQLPVEVHTKFIEENSALIQSLLHFLIPDHVRNPDQKRFAERFYLKYDEPLIRVRMLDSADRVAKHFSDISIPLSDFEQCGFPARNVLIAENKMNFLTLPSLPSSIAVWSGGGFNVGYLKGAGWLSAKKIYYWGDIDEHGFQILHQLRHYCPHAKSVLMDRETFDRFNSFAVNGRRAFAETLDLLTPDEACLYRYLKSLESRNRLEQEKLPQAYVDEVLSRLFSFTPPLHK